MGEKLRESFHFYHVCISNFNWLMWWSFLWCVVVVVFNFLFRSLSYWEAFAQKRRQEYLCERDSLISFGLCCIFWRVGIESQYEWREYFCVHKFKIYEFYMWVSEWKSMVSVWICVERGKYIIEERREKRRFFFLKFHIEKKI